MELNRAVWAEVNLDHLAHNISEVRRVTRKDALVTAVIKADGYGHGASMIAKTLLENGADRLAVATLTEAVSLRKACPGESILVLGYTEKNALHYAVEQDLIQTIYTYEQALEANDIAQSLNKKITLHIKIDSGMTRLGMMPSDETIEAIEKMMTLDHVIIEGIYTHFARADEEDKTATRMQVEQFEYVRKGLEDRGITLLNHVSNSASIIDLPEYNYDMVRAGIMLYGLYPSDEVSKNDVKLKEVMSLHTKLSRVQCVGPDTGVSYGHKYVSSSPTKVGTLPIGYADGYSRSFTFKAETIVKGKDVKVPVIGRICMDQCMVDLSGIDASIGDEIILFGCDENQVITIDDMAKHLDTINYEIVCMINKRVPRVYKKSGEIIEVIDNIMVL